jgi:alkylhydroperoxidase family enzyme
MAWIRTIEPEEASGELAQEYAEAVRRAGRVYNVVKLTSLNPPLLHAWVELYKVLMFGPSPLERYEREMVATVVSRENRCHY